jgi:adenylosuccinate lyase
MIRIAPDNMQLAIQSFDWTPTPEAVRTREGETQHDVVAFLSLMQDKMPEPWHRYLHYAMTSSDLVENAHFWMLRTHLSQLTVKWSHLYHATHASIPFNKEAEEPKAVPRPGRTHGQLAEVTSWNHQMVSWSYGAYSILVDAHKLNPTLLATKSIGPTGCSSLRQDQFPYVVPSTQVIPRDFQLAWASIYLRLACQMENLALLVRNGSRSEVGEIREGRLSTQVGSSAMPHKRNPIKSEKVCGLARVARGLFATIAESTGALWDDRDISNSSVERVAVPDLAHTVEHMIDTMLEVMLKIEIDEDRMVLNAKNPECWTGVVQSLIQKHTGIGPVKAGDVVRRLLADGDPEWLLSRTYHWFIESFPQGVSMGNDFLREYAAAWDLVFEPTEPTNPDLLLSPF